MFDDWKLKYKRDTFNYIKILKLKNSGNQPEFIHQSKNEQS